MSGLGVGWLRSPASRGGVSDRRRRKGSRLTRVDELWRELSLYLFQNCNEHRLSISSLCLQQSALAFKDPKGGENPDALGLRFNCKNRSLLYELTAKIAPKCTSLRFNCK